jgi:SAM-dependent methyltransferase
MNVAEHDQYATAADLYDYVGPYRARPDVSFFVESAVSGGGPVLELGCGTGRVLIPTARAGIDIVGLDSSSSMLSICRERLRGEKDDVSGRVRLVHGDMRKFVFDDRFALVTTPFRSFQHLLSVDDQLACLSCVRGHLRDDGRLILDLFNPSIDGLARTVGEEFGEEPEFVTPDGRRVTRRFRIAAQDRFAQVNDVELFYDVTHPDGRQERLVHAFGMRWVFRFEAEHLLARAGFEVEHLYAGYDRSEYGSSYPGELVFIARKASSGRV